MTPDTIPTPETHHRALRAVCHHSLLSGHARDAQWDHITDPSELLNEAYGNASKEAEGTT